MTEKCKPRADQQQGGGPCGLQLLGIHRSEGTGTCSTLFMKQVLPRLQRPRKPYGKL